MEQLALLSVGFSDPSTPAGASLCKVERSVNIDLAGLQATLRRCNKLGVVQTEAFKISLTKQAKLASDFQRLRVKEFESPIVACQRPTEGIEKLTLSQRNGGLRTYVPVDAVIQDDGCTNPSEVHGIFERRELQALLEGFESLSTSN